MRTTPRLALLTALLLLLARGGAQSTAVTAPGACGTARTALAGELHAAANDARRAHGLAPLDPDPHLARAAQCHAEEMARLGYFAHASPTPARATLAQRAALAGSALVEVAENLALIGRPSGVASAAVDGWLASPGHRANLLGGFDRVGHGAAPWPAGGTVIVQVLGAEPFSLRAAAVAVEREQLRVELILWAGGELESAVAVGASPPRVVPLDPGVRRLSFDAEATGPVQVRVGARGAPGAAFVVEDAGWLDPASGEWRPDPSATRERLRIEGASAVKVTEEVAEVTVRHDAPVGVRVEAFLGDRHLRPERSEPGLLLVTVPMAELPAVLLLGEAGVGGRVRLTHRFTLSAAGGRAELAPGETQLPTSPGARGH